MKNVATDSETKKPPPPFGKDYLYALAPLYVSPRELFWIVVSVAAMVTALSLWGF